MFLFRLVLFVCSFCDRPHLEVKFLTPDLSNCQMTTLTGLKADVLSVSPSCFRIFHSRPTQHLGIFRNSPPPSEISFNEIVSHMQLFISLMLTIFVSCFSVYSGHHTILIPPGDLETNPALWLSVVSQYKGNSCICHSRGYRSEARAFQLFDAILD